MVMARPAGLADQRRDAGTQLRRVGRREYREHAGERERSAGVDPDDPRVSVGTANQGRVDGVGQADVIHVAAAAGEQAPVFLALDRRADHARDFKCSSRRDCRPPST